MDIAQAALAVFMFSENGDYDGKQVPGIDPEKFLAWMVSKAMKSLHLVEYCRSMAMKVFMNLVMWT